MLLSCFADRFLYIFRKNGFFATQHGVDVLFLDLHIVKGAYSSNDVIVHGDHTTFQTTAELHVRTAVFEKQYICGISADINQEQPQMMIHLSSLWGNCSECLRIYVDISNQNGKGHIIVGKMDRLVTLEVLDKLLLQKAEVFGR